MNKIIKDDSKLKVFDFLSKHGILFEEVSTSKTREYIVEPPKVYCNFATQRFEGVASFVVKREITDESMFYVRYGMEKVISNSKYTVYNKESEIFVLEMKFEIKNFLFNPPNFQPAFWVRTGYSCIIPVEEKKIKLRDYKYIHKFLDYGEKDRLLKAIYDKTLDSIEEEAPIYQEQCTGVVDSLVLPEGYSVIPEMVCPICSKPVIGKEEHEVRCICSCGAVPVKVPKRMWLRNVQANRYNLYRISSMIIINNIDIREVLGNS